MIGIDLSALLALYAALCLPHNSLAQPRPNYPPHANPPQPGVRPTNNQPIISPQMPGQGPQVQMGQPQQQYVQPPAPLAVPQGGRQPPPIQVGAPSQTRGLQSPQSQGQVAPVPGRYEPQPPQVQVGSPVLVRGEPVPLTQQQQPQISGIQPGIGQQPQAQAPLSLPVQGQTRVLQPPQNQAAPVLTRPEPQPQVQIQPARGQDREESFHQNQQGSGSSLQGQSRIDFNLQSQLSDSEPQRMEPPRVQTGSGLGRADLPTVPGRYEPQPPLVQIGPPPEQVRGEPVSQIQPARGQDREESFHQNQQGSPSHQGQGRIDFNLQSQLSDSGPEPPRVQAGSGLGRVDLPPVPGRIEPQPPQVQKGPPPEQVRGEIQPKRGQDREESFHQNQQGSGSSLQGQRRIDPNFQSQLSESGSQRMEPPRDQAGPGLGKSDLRSQEQEAPRYPTRIDSQSQYAPHNARDESPSSPTHQNRPVQQNNDRRINIEELAEKMHSVVVESVMSHPHIELSPSENQRQRRPPQNSQEIAKTLPEEPPVPLLNQHARITPQLHSTNQQETFAKVQGEQNQESEELPSANAPFRNLPNKKGRPHAWSRSTTTKSTKKSTSVKSTTTRKPPTTTTTKKATTTTPLKKRSTQSIMKHAPLPPEPEIVAVPLPNSKPDFEPVPNNSGFRNRERFPQRRKPINSQLSEPEPLPHQPYDPDMNPEDPLPMFVPVPRPSPEPPVKKVDTVDLQDINAAFPDANDMSAPQETKGFVQYYDDKSVDGGVNNGNDYEVIQNFVNPNLPEQIPLSKRLPPYRFQEGYHSNNRHIDTQHVKAQRSALDYDSGKEEKKPSSWFTSIFSGSESLTWSRSRVSSPWTVLLVVLISTMIS